MTCPACRTQLPAGVRACTRCGSLIAFAAERPQARLQAPLPPWEQEVMATRRPSVTHQQLRPPVALVAAGVRPGSGRALADPQGTVPASGPDSPPRLVATPGPDSPPRLVATSRPPSTAAVAGPSALTAELPATRVARRAAAAAAASTATAASAPARRAAPSTRSGLAEALAPLRLLGPRLLELRGAQAALLVAAGAPFLLAAVATADRTWLAAGGFAACCAALWVYPLRALVRPEPVSGWLVAQLAVFVAVGGTLLACVMQLALHPDPTNLAWAVLGVALPEQAVSVAPMVVVVLLAARPWTTRTFLYAGAVCGLTFSVVETVAFPTLHLPGGPAGTAELTAEAAWQLLTAGLVHAAATAIAAGFVAMASWRPEQRWALVGIGVGTSALLLGLQDWTAGWPAAVIGLLTVLALAAFVQGGDAIAHELAGDGDVRQLEPGQLPPAAA